MLINTFGNSCYVLTGGIGSGKSTILSICKTRGFDCLSMDEICREVLDTNTIVKKNILNRWGADVFYTKNSNKISNSEVNNLSNLKINRKEISKIVFVDEIELIWLEKLLYSEIINLFEKKLAKYQNSILIVEIPLFFEKKIMGNFSGVACVISSFLTRKQRVLERQFSVEQFSFIASHQKTDVEKVDMSDFVIANSGSLECLEKQVLLWLTHCINHNINF